jgi:hypothetical protein
MRVWDYDRTDSHFDRALHADLLPQLVASTPFMRRSAPSPVTLPERTNRARLGLAWACSDGLDHLERSVSLRVLLPFFWRPDIEFYSLQVGGREQDACIYQRFLHLPDPPLESFADTANLIASLDGVITVDTAVAHLAGSLGVPTLTLLPFPSDLIWGFADTTPWYPTMRCIRQRSRGDWVSVQSQVQEALDSHWWEGVGDP